MESNLVHPRDEAVDLWCREDPAEIVELQGELFGGSEDLSLSIGEHEELSTLDVHLHQIDLIEMHS